MYVSLSDERPYWCVVRTKPRWEERVAACLEAEEISSYAPKVVRTCPPNPRRAGARRKERYEKPKMLFPGYVFVQLAPRDCVERMRWFPGVRHTLSQSTLVAAVADEDVQEIRGRENEKGVIEIPVPPLRAGEHICVVEGPFEGLEGLFERYLTSAERVQILLKLLGALRHVELPRRSVMASA
jgi:transcriptional antiterminator NusG